MAISGQIPLSDVLEQLSAALAAWPPRKKYLVAVSGGRDSMALLFGLHSLGYRKLVVCHLNNHLRGPAAKADSHLAGTMRSSEAVHETIDVRGSFLATMLMTRSKRASSIFCAEAEQLDSEG